MIKNFKTKFKKAQSSFEFLAVFVVLFVLFLTILDLGLYFRQIYLVQTTADEAFTKLQSNNYCATHIDRTAQTLSDTIFNFYNVRVNLNHVQTNGFHQFSSGRHKFYLICKTVGGVEFGPDTLNYEYSYDGILMFHNTKIYSNFSSNIQFF